MTPAALQPRTWLLASLVARLLMALVLGQLTSAATILQPGEGLGRRAGGGFSDASSATSATRLPGGRGLEVNGKLYRLQLRYTACTGLVNQQYSHIATFTLAAALGVSEVHLPPAAVRDSFGHKFSVHQEQNQMQWFPARASCLLDVERLQRVWARQGITVHEPLSLLPFPDLMFPSGAFILTPLPGLDPRAVVRVHGIYMAGMELHQLVALVRKAAEAHLGRLAAAFPDLQLSDLLLELPCTFFSLHTTPILPVVSQVASTLHFNPALEYIADRVVAYMTRDGRRTFNGAHLRVEKDAGEWIAILGGPAAVWGMYLDTMAAAGFDAASPLFVATGLLSYGAEIEFKTGVALLIGQGMCSEVLYKEEYVPPFEMQRLNSEQLALLDFLILARAEKFVGFGPSTFSTYLQEHRVLHGTPPANSLLVNASRIGTNSMFARSSLVASRRISSLGAAKGA
ncbi:hypothetical protein D9Q98_003957 [Chlorella vulgaris]|uniref:O-fucosyltransferase family protein n=1 Tax=Chlorella vulgaris TaxID=3077 RepID=A0A9D4YY37_CHLVU|nr:hypothetical protein D9Q98_003957 [Chlorella vulgaris]